MKGALLLVAIVALFASQANAQGNTTSICDRYSKTLNLTNNQLIGAVVTGVFTNITNPNVTSSLLYFFDGSTINYPGGVKVDFRNTSDARSLLLGLHLIQFFGRALNCTDGTIGGYAGLSLTQSHSFMMINASQFDYFNQIVLGVMAGYGVQPLDLTAAAGVLETTRSGVCTLCATPTTADTSAATSDTMSVTTATVVPSGSDASVLSFIA
jgi:hypothetical protein